MVPSARETFIELEVEGHQDPTSIGSTRSRVSSAAYARHACTSFPREPGIRVEDGLHRLAVGEELDDLPDHDAGALHAGLAVAGLRVDGNALEDISHGRLISGSTR